MKNGSPVHHDNGDALPRRLPPMGRDGRADAAPRLGTDGPVLITGGAGFIGTNIAQRMLHAGREVILFDNITRRGVEENAQWLLERYPGRAHLWREDVRDAAAVRRAVKQASCIFHFAAQVAVTTSLTRPIEDFEINARGTLNVLEALRAHPSPPPLLFTSTNKVYGSLDWLALHCDGSRYEPTDPLQRGGINEHALTFCSPYGCSKGAADQYVLDYAHTFDLPTVVFRMSCIYGPHQHGNEDQGWLAHFLMRSLADEPITLFGDGKQVRDVLFVEDLANAMVLAMDRMGDLKGRAFNIGGGPGNAVSLIELVDLIARITGRRPRCGFDRWRLADQRYYVTDITRFAQATGWRPQIDVREGVIRLHRWLGEQQVVRRQQALAVPIKGDVRR